MVGKRGKQLHRSTTTKNYIHKKNNGISSVEVTPAPPPEARCQGQASGGDTLMQSPGGHQERRTGR